MTTPWTKRARAPAELQTEPTSFADLHNALLANDGHEGVHPALKKDGGAAARIAQSANMRRDDHVPTISAASVESYGEGRVFGGANHFAEEVLKRLELVTDTNSRFTQRHYRKFAEEWRNAMILTAAYANVFGHQRAPFADNPDAAEIWDENCLARLRPAIEAIVGDAEKALHGLENHIQKSEDNASADGYIRDLMGGLRKVTEAWRSELGLEPVARGRQQGAA